MKKLILGLLALLLCLQMSACKGNDNDDERPKPTPDTQETIQDEPEHEQLTLIRQSAADESCVAAVAYLGYYDEANAFDVLDYLDELGMMDMYPFLQDLPSENVITLEGADILLIVPADESSEITVYEWVVDEYNGYQGEPGNALFNSKKGDAILVVGSFSETMPNFMVEILSKTQGDLQYVPFLSGMDGTLEVPYELPWVLDISVYETMGDFYFDESLLTSAESWDTEVYTYDDQYFDLSLNFYDDGYFRMSYGPVDDMLNVFYEGYYDLVEQYESDNCYTLELYLVENASDDEVAESLVLQVQFDVFEGNLVMNILDGDSLTGKEVDTSFLFVSSLG